METIGERIAFARKAAGLSQEELGAKLGVTKAAVSNWETGATKSPTPDNVLGVAKATGYRIEWLITGKEPREAEYSRRKRGMPAEAGNSEGSNAELGPELAPSRRIPVLGTAQLGDNGYWAELEFPVGYGDGYVSFPSRDPKAYAVRCRGDSMRPRIRDGEFVVVEPESEPIPGDEVLVKAKDGRVMVKTYLYQRDGRVHLISVNEAHPPQSLALEDIETLHPVAAIVKKALWSE
ncbi:XRE family transcriptional regulator [Methylococcus mesophilus]|uniref:XRE family transcriptional regulator n=1 Tax=Methylococcus mesophilus TaxID=2993564 RepID=UPI00224AE5D5|nr:helix-turn-helix transcriptional regulator [Methylococcus mesophilus]UZR29057.1 helix-turn-helix transcriptional regulator [Methylococcus mesophilus]